MCTPGFIGNANDLKVGCKAQDHCRDDFDCRDNDICFQVGKGIRKCVDACTKLQCGPNALCVVSNHRSSCMCNELQYGNPSDLKIGCQPERALPKGVCNSDKDCSGGFVCSINTEGYRSCVNPCSKVICGQNEVCNLDKNKQATCSCRKGYIWNPVTSVCEKPSLPECADDRVCSEHAACKPDALGILKCHEICQEISCPQNAVCVANNHRGHCECLAGYTGNPNDRNGCQLQIREHCTDDDQCSPFDVCREDDKSGLRSCKPACDYVVCGPNALCVANNHVAKCQCLPGLYTGDASGVVGCQPVSCVFNNDCPPNQMCNRLTHTCYDICEKDTCGENAVCIAEHHKSLCQCPPGFKPSPTAEIKCVYLDICNPSPCHPTAVCEVTPAGVAACRCPPNQIGDPIGVGCHEEGACAQNNSDCPPSSVCQNGKCVDPCDGYCGSNALCTLENGGQPVCSCPSKFESILDSQTLTCVRTIFSCNTDAECSGDICINGECKSMCRSLLSLCIHLFILEIL